MTILSRFYFRFPFLLFVLSIFASCFSSALQVRSQENVIWHVLPDDYQYKNSIPTSTPDVVESMTSYSSNQTIVDSNSIQWQVIPPSKPPSNEEHSHLASVVWLPILDDHLLQPDSNSPPPSLISWEPLVGIDPLTNLQTSGDVVSPDISPEFSAIPQISVSEQNKSSDFSASHPQPSPLQSLNRSIAFGDGSVGPDISLRIPNGFRWSQRWFGDVTIVGYDYQNGRNPGDPFIPALNSADLDGWGIVHLNVLQTKNWSMALNTSFRSLQSNPNIGGGSTGIEDGVSSGFRIARAIGDTGGIAFGGEQVIQWDDNTDTGRNLYLMASNGWWLGRNGTDYPLFVANGGFGSGRFASLTDDDEPFNFTCIPVESNRKVGRIDENLCWGPIGSVSLVVNEWWGVFVDYAISRATFGVSTNLTGGIPIRITGGVNFVENEEFVPFDELRWIFEASLGF